MNCIGLGGGLGGGAVTARSSCDQLTLV